MCQECHQTLTQWDSIVPEKRCHSATQVKKCLEAHRAELDALYAQTRPLEQEIFELRRVLETIKDRLIDL